MWGSHTTISRCSDARSRPGEHCHCRWPPVTDPVAHSPAEGVGLSSAEARRRLAETGPNVIVEAKPPSHARRLIAQLVHLFALLLWAGAVLAWLAGMPQLSIAIVVVVLVNAGFAFAQEYRAERAAEALRGMLPQRARVRRDGAEEARKAVVRRRVGRSSP